MVKSGFWKECKWIEREIDPSGFGLYFDEQIQRTLYEIEIGNLSIESVLNSINSELLKIENKISGIQDGSRKETVWVNLEDLIIDKNRLLYAKNLIARNINDH